MKKYDVITIGSGLIDASIQTGLKGKNGLIPIPVGRKIHLNYLDFSNGGGGTNTAVAFRKLGLKVGFLGKIGSGYNGQIILRELKKDKVDFLGVTSKEHTGYSIILKTKDNRRTILSFKGTSDDLKYSEVQLRKLKTKWFHLTSMNHESFKTQKKLIGFAKKNGIKISFNPGMSKIKQGYRKIKKIIKNANFLSMNKEEAETLVGKRKDLKKLLHALYKLGSRIVCITDGEKSGGVYDGNHYYIFHPRKIRIKECTGSGDAFASTFIAGLIRFNDIQMSLKLALINAESVIQVVGTKNGLLTMNQAKSLISKHDYKIKKELA